VLNLKLPVSELLKIPDPREVPSYGIPLAAHYLRLPTATLSSWVLGRRYRVQGGKKTFRPWIHVQDKRVPLLSFYNLAEAHVLSAFRREHQIPMARIRTALDYVSREFGWKRPLIEQDFQTDGVGLLIEHLGHLVDAAAGGQIVMRKCVEQHLKRMEWENKLVARLYPFTHTDKEKSPKLVLIDPKHSFGRPFLAKTRVPTAIIAERYKAGDSIEHLAEDYACPRAEIEEAVRCELSMLAA
jgi:uncharacterized protein (DUF433 family)